MRIAPCYGRAIGLSEDPAARTFLAQRSPTVL